MSACPCQSGSSYDACCGPFHNATALPETPEQLMRSRYSAFALRLPRYLEDTWHPGTRPDSVEVGSGTTWLGLRIIDAPAPAPKRGVVEFEATYREAGAVSVLHERSRFVLQSGRWWYLDGEHSNAD